MPRIPSRYAGTLGVPPELQVPRRDKTPVPVRGQEAAEEKPRRLRVGLDKLNLRTYEPDKDQLIKALFGKEPDVDPYTRQLVLDLPAAPAAPAVGH